MEVLNHATDLFHRNGSKHLYASTLWNGTPLEYPSGILARGLRRMVLGLYVDVLRCARLYQVIYSDAVPSDLPTAKIPAVLLRVARRRFCMGPMGRPQCDLHVRAGRQLLEHEYLCLGPATVLTQNHYLVRQRRLDCSKMASCADEC